MVIDCIVFFKRIPSPPVPWRTTPTQQLHWHKQQEWFTINESNTLQQQTQLQFCCHRAGKFLVRSNITTNSQKLQAQTNDRDTRQQLLQNAIAFAQRPTDIQQRMPDRHIRSHSMLIYLSANFVCMTTKKKALRMIMCFCLFTFICCD